MSYTNIEWCHRPGTLPEVWNIVTGCNKVSPGCKNCYAEKMHKRLQGLLPKKYNHDFLSGAHFHDDLLHLPMTWKKPRTVFVNSMSDLFHEDVDQISLSVIFSVMSNCPEHTFIVLTKRPENFIKFIEWKKGEFNIPWQPSDNVWIGVSVENQETANQRIPLLLRLPAKVRFLSCEPLLGSIDLSEFMWLTDTNNAGGDLFEKRQWGYDFWSGGFVDSNNFLDLYNPKSGIHWVIVGGESGHNARPMHPDWAKQIRDQCEFAQVPFFFKQWGEWKVYHWPEEIGTKPYGMFSNNQFRHGNVVWDYQKSSIYMSKVGKKKAGHLLDGMPYQEFPKVESNG